MEGRSVIIDEFVRFLAVFLVSMLVDKCLPWFSVDVLFTVCVASVELCSTSLTSVHCSPESHHGNVIDMPADDS